MKKNKTVWKSCLVSLCFAPLLLYSTPSPADYKEKAEEIVENHSKNDTNPQAWKLFENYGLNEIVFTYLPTIDIQKIIISVFGNTKQMKFGLLDGSINGFGNLDGVYKIKDNNIHRLNLTPEENKKFKEFYSKTINKFYSRINPQEPNQDWISVFEKKLKNYYQEKDEMKDLLEIVENHKI